MTRLPASLKAADYLTRARQYRAQANKLADMEGNQPNWPKHFLMTHAMELAIDAYLIFEAGLSDGKEPSGHDLLRNYNKAVQRGLKSSALVLEKLPHLSGLHKKHYARYPKIEAKPFPVFISDYDDMVVQLFADVGHTLKGLGG